MRPDRDPWQTLATYWPKVNVFIRVLSDVWGQTIWPDRGPAYIELAHDLGPIQQRCTLAHELHHLEFGRPCTSFCGDNEREVCEATARWLLPDLEVVGNALAVHDVATAAGELSVTRKVLTDRLSSLGEREEDELGRLLKSSTRPGRSSAEDESDGSEAAA